MPTIARDQSTARSTLTCSSIAVLTAAGMLCAAPTARAQSTIEWASPVDGDFSEVLNWFPAVVPGAMDTAVLGGAGPYVVMQNVVGGEVANLLLTNPQATLRVPSGRSLTVGGLKGPGEVIVQDTPGGRFSARIIARDGATLNGRIRLAGFGDAQAIVEAQGGTTAILGPDAIVVGRTGGLLGNWISFGTIEIDLPGFLGAREIDARGGTLRASNGGTLALNFATIQNVAIEAGPNGKFDTNSSTVISDSVIRGEFTIEPAKDVTFATGVDIEGELVLHGVPTDSRGARLLLLDDVVFDGTVRLEGSSPTAATIRAFGPSTGQSLGPNAVITGRNGTISTGWTSEADIFIDQPGEINVNGLNAIAGTLRSSNGGVLNLSGCSLTNVTIVAGPDNQFKTSFSTVITDSRIVGAYAMRPGTVLTLGSGVVIEDEIIMHDDPGSSLTSTLRVNPGVTVDGVIRMEGNEPMRARLEPASGTGQTLGPAGTITGSVGQIRGGPWTIRGTLAPSQRSAELGFFELFDADLTLEPSARIEIDIAGRSPIMQDRISGTGDIELDGALKVFFGDGFITGPRDQFEVIRATDVEGSFADIDIEPVGAFGPAHVVYTGDAVIVVACAADRDADGELTVFDLLAYRNQFIAGDLRADLDQDGQLTIFDFLVYQNRFDAGCG